MWNLALVLAAASGSSVAGLHAAPARERAEAIFDHLASETGRNIPVRSSPTEALASLVSEAETSTGAEYVVVVPTSSSALAVVRPEDRAVFLRRFAPEVGPLTPYAAAVAAIELIDLLRAKPISKPPPPPPPKHVGFVASAGASVTGGPDPVMLQPLLQVGLEIDDYMPPSVGFDVHLGALFPGTTGRSHDVRFVRFGAEVGLRLHLRTRYVQPFLHATFFASSSHVELDGEEERERTSFGPGAQAGVRFVVGGLVVDLGGGLGIVLNPATFTVSGALGLEEARLRPMGRITVGWASI